MEVTIEKYSTGENGFALIVQSDNGKFFSEYGTRFHIPDCSAGPFSTLLEARKALLKHRPNAALLTSINNMCIGCKKLYSCGGTDCQIWTGCAMKQA